MSATSQTHPATGTDYSTPVFVTRDGTPRYAIGGAADPAPADAPPADAPPADAPPADAPPADAPPADAPPADEPPPGETPEAKATRLEAEVAKLRRENGSARTKAKADAADEARAALAQTIGKALGLVKDDKPVDPAELAKQIEQSKSGERTAQVHLAVFKTAGKHQGDPTALLDSSSFLAKLADLDPTASDFDTKVGEVIKTAVEANPKLKAGPASGSSSVDHPGGGGAPRRTEAPSMLDAVNSALST